MTDSNRSNGAAYEIGYCRPPEHTRFQPGKSGNPSGRPKGAQNFKTLFEKILKEQIPLREGEVTKKISKAEAIMRRLIIGALKGDSRDLHALFRLAEQTGQFAKDEEAAVQVVQFTWLSDREAATPPLVPANRRLNRESA